MTEMTGNQRTNEKPWWESELPVIQRELGKYLRWRLPAWSADHDDLLSNALLGLTEQIRRRASTLPTSWFQLASPENDADRSHLHKLALVILRRRIADLFRSRASLPTSLETEKGTRDVTDMNTPAPDRQIMLGRILEITRSVLDELDAEDRDLIALISADDGIRKSLDARERQRLARARKKLRKAIADHLGADLTELLRSRSHG